MTEVYCICKGPSDDRFMVLCEKCEEWFHASCISNSIAFIIGFSKSELDLIKEFHCFACEKTYGPSVCNSSYLIKVDEEKVKNMVHLEDQFIHYRLPEEYKNQNLFLLQLKMKKFESTPSKFAFKASDFTLDYIKESFLPHPLLFSASDKNNLGMKMPKEKTTVQEIAQMIGDCSLQVIDVQKQENFIWTLYEWAKYYHTKKKKYIYNVISFEVSETSFNDLIVRPEMVRSLDWNDLFWPKELKDKGTFPKVQVYCLMSPAGCWTDFHIDFAGTSVYYHMIKGKKKFYMIPPTKENLLWYEKWCKLENQSKIFFSDRVPVCYEVEIKTGETMIIPGGWIHAVYTDEDSIVIGGNFLCLYKISLQISIYEIEQRCKTPKMFTYPHFEKSCWLAAQYYYQLLKNNKRDFMNERELKELENLVTFLDLQYQRTQFVPSVKGAKKKEISRFTDKQLKVSASKKKFIRSQIPEEFLDKTGIKKFLKQFYSLLDDLRKEKPVIEKKRKNNSMSPDFVKKEKKTNTVNSNPFQFFNNFPLPPFFQANLFYRTIAPKPPSSETNNSNLNLKKEL